jgi:hypothetical protein
MNIYHYTSANALLNILKTNTLWGTDISFLNDSKELIEGLKVISKFGHDQYHDFNGDESHPYHLWNKIMTELTNQTIKFSENNSINIISFTTDSDYIRQWMSYCPSNAGYCIEFDFDILYESTAKDNNYTHLEPVYYYNADDEFGHKGFVTKKINDIFSELSAIHIVELYNSIPDDQKQNHPLPADIQPLWDQNLSRDELIQLYLKKAGLYRHEALFRAATIKPIEFSDEKEYRIVKLIHPDDTNSSIKHRERNGILVPYVELKFNINSIKRIIIGPCVHSSLAEKGLQSLLKTLGLIDKIQISHSNCSLRSY